MPTRYQNTGTVSDEHGKGAEVLRTASVGLEGAVTVAAGNRAVLVAEVDCIIREFRVASAVAPTAGAVTLQRVRGNNAPVNISTAVTIPATRGGVATGTINDQYIRRGDIVLVSVTTAVTGATARVVAQVGWMPNIWSVDGNFRTYSTPS